MHTGTGPNTQGALGKEESLIKRVTNPANREAAENCGNTQSAGGDVKGNMVGRDYIKIYYGYEKPDDTRNRNLEQNIEKKFGKLKEVLIASAKENCILEDTSFSEKNGRYPGHAPLQMVQHPEMFNPDKYGPTRKEILNLFKYSSLDCLQPEEFFEKAKEVVKDLPEYKRALLSEAQNKCLSKLANVIGVIGQPGVGKSILSKILLQRIVSGNCRFISEERLCKIDYIFYVKIGEFCNQTEMNLLQFLIGEEVCSSLDWMNDEKICKEILNLLNKSESVCILLDGLDDTALTILDQFKVNTMVNYGQYLPQNFILGLLSGKILPNAKKIFTSKPGPMLNLPDRFRPKFLVQILGINSDGIKKICENLCGDKSSQVLAHVKNQPDLYSYITIPFHCVSITNYVYDDLENKIANFFPDSITDVFTLSYIDFINSKHMREDLKQFDIKNMSDLRNICSLAWYGIEKQKFCFVDKELRKFDLNHYKINSFTVTVKCQNQTRDKITYSRPDRYEPFNCTYFTHLLIQEFFAAIYCLFFMNEETFQKTFSVSSIISNQYLMVVKFMFGLLNIETFKMLQSKYPNFSEPTKRQTLLKYHVFTIVTNSNTFNQLSSAFRAIAGRWRRLSPPSSLNFNLLHSVDFRSSLSFFGKHINLGEEHFFVASLLYENRELSFVKNVADLFPSSIQIVGDVLPADVLSICYVLKHRMKPLELRVNANFTGNAILLFIKELKCLLSQSSCIKIALMKLSSPPEFDDLALEELLELQNLASVKDG